MIAALASRSAPHKGRRTFAVLATLACSLVWSASARAEGPTDYCKRITARADADAALLFGPTVHTQLIRFPSVGAADASGFQVGRDVQPRAALSIGLIDIYKGFGVLDVAKVECSRQQTTEALLTVVAQRADVGRVPALEAKLAFFRQHADAVDEIVRKAEERFAAHTSTLAEVQDLRMRSFAFRSQIARTETEIAMIKARTVDVPAQPLDETLRTYEQRSVELEERVSHVRNLMPWKFTVTGGVAATPSVDAFGVAELSYNIGGIFQHGPERRAIEARASELKTARYEMRQNLETMTRELKVSAEQSRAQARAIAEELARIARDRATLEGAEAPNKHTLVATLSLQMLELEAEQTFLTTLADKQSSFGVKK